jgi:hypothetical protein
MQTRASFALLLATGQPDDSEPDDHRTWRGRVVAEPRQKFSRVSVQVYLLCIVTDF